VAPAVKASPEARPWPATQPPVPEPSSWSAQRAIEAFDRGAPKRPKSRNPLRAREKAPVLVADLDPTSVASEAYRALRVNIEFMPHAEGCRNIVITSPSQGEGTSTTAANLAVASAQAGWRVCLVDADFRRPVIHAAFGLPNRGGLVKALSERRPLSTVALPSNFPGLSVVVAGEYDPGQTDLFSTDRIQQVRQDCESHYDLVLWDTPPIILVADAINLVAQCDGVILVVRSGAIPSSVLRRASRQIAQVNGRILGVLLNGVDLRRTDQEFYRYYHAYQQSGSDA
jgi:protein-tyrosine kinase